MVYNLVYQTSWKVYYSVGVFARHVSVKHICYVLQHMRYKTSATVRLTVSLQRLLVEYLLSILGTIKYYKFITAKIIILIHNSTGLHRAVHRDINLTVHLYLLIVTGYQKSLSGTIINSITKNSILQLNLHAYSCTTALLSSNLFFYSGTAVLYSCTAVQLHLYSCTVRLKSTCRTSRAPCRTRTSTWYQVLMYQGTLRRWNIFRLNILGWAIRQKIRGSKKCHQNFPKCWGLRRGLNRIRHLSG